MRATVLIRIPLPRALVERLDQMVALARAALGRKVSRAAVVRALLALSPDVITPALHAALTLDAVKRGRPAKEAS